MKVYVLIHSYDEGSEVRGIYTTHELATEAMTVSEYGRSESINHEYWIEHNEYCCGVDEVEVLDHLELPYHGPKNIDLRTITQNRGGWLVPASFAEIIGRSIFSENVYRVSLVDSTGYIEKEEP